MKFVTLINENGNNHIQKEFGTLKEGFEAFQNFNVEELKDGHEYELVKYDEDDTAQDWTDEELKSINWPLNTWVTKSK